MPRKRNAGLRKRCDCPRERWTKCPHSWHLNFKWRDKHYRFSIDKEVGKHVETKKEAEAEADKLKTAIREAKFHAPADELLAEEGLTFRQFAETWKDKRGKELVTAKDDGYRLQTICNFVLPSVEPRLLLGDKLLQDITTADVEAFRDARKAAGLSAVTVNHDLKLLRKMFNWAIRKAILEGTPFKIGTEPAISLERETPRARRFESEDDEERLLNAANPHLRSLITAMLDTACRPGELLSLQWKDVSLERKELTIRAEKTKTRTARLIPISTRLAAILEMRKLDPAGRPFPTTAYVFGDAVGGAVKSVRTAWENAAEKAGLKGLQLRDLRHESGSRFDEAGVPISYVSKMLGHSNLTTTSRYLNVHRRGLQAAMKKLEEHRSTIVAQPLHTDAEDAQDVVRAEESRPPRLTN